MIRKISIILAGIVFTPILAAGVTPVVFGIKAENVYNQWVEHWAKLGDFRVVSKKYDRGWFSSSAETIFEYSRGDNPILTLSEYDYITHGPIALKAILQRNIKFEPFLARIKTEVRGQSKSRSEFADILKLLPPLEIDTVFSLRGDGTSNISMQSFSYRHESLKESISWKGLSGNSTFVPMGNKLNFDLNLPRFEIIDGDFSWSLDNAHIALDFEDAGNPINGQLSSILFKVKTVEIHDISIDSEEINSLFLSGFETSWSTTINGGLINGSQKSGFDRLILNDSNQFGPGALEMAVRNLDESAIKGIKESIYALDGELIFDQKQNLALFGGIMKYLPQLADYNPEFEITKLSLLTTDGELVGRAKIYVDGNGSQLKLNPFYVINAIKADAMISVPKIVFEYIIKEIARDEIEEAFNQKGEEIPSEDQLSLLVESASNEKIKSLLQLNIFAFNDNDYELKLAYSKGLLELNGQAIPIPFLPP